MQVPIDASIGNTFAQCLRAILRQDPDKILVGEIRDLETAEIAVQASLTGHTVFSTLHTNDAPSTITRLRDMGVQPFLITATVEAILAQRLVRRICTQLPRGSSAQRRNAGRAATDAVGRGRQEVLSRHAAATHCNNTGYKGRVGLFELMIMNDDLREMIMRNASTDESARHGPQLRHGHAARMPACRPCYAGTHHDRRSRARNHCGRIRAEECEETRNC